MQEVNRLPGSHPLSWIHSFILGKKRSIRHRDLKKWHLHWRHLSSLIRPMSHFTKIAQRPHSQYHVVRMSHSNVIFTISTRNICFVYYLFFYHKAIMATLNWITIFSANTFKRTTANYVGHAFAGTTSFFIRSVNQIPFQILVVGQMGTRFRQVSRPVTWYSRFSMFRIELAIFAENGIKPFDNLMVIRKSSCRDWKSKHWLFPV